MGQAVVDLPDPLQNPKPAPSADDMLAQLASDEIDRLLADSDDGKEAPSSPPPVSELPTPKSDAPAAASIPPTPTPPPAQVEVAAVQPPAVEDRSAADDLAERKALIDAASATPPAAAPAEPIQLMELRIPPTLPAILRPLEWLSAPLDSCPDTVREFVGRAAVLTMINAIALLGYVWLFRRHH